MAALTRALSGECGGSAARALGVVVTGVPDAQAAAVAAGAVPLLAALLVRGDPGACEGAVAALRSEQALGRCFDVGSKEGDGPTGEGAQASWDKLFQSARRA